MEHYDVLIATPGANLEAKYVKSLVKTLSECTKRNITFKWLNAYSSLIHHARELTATGGSALELNPNHKGPLGDSVSYNKIFWIDSDIEWNPEDFFKLYDSEFEVISGAYLLSDGFTTSVHSWESPGGMPAKEILELETPINVQSIGFGFVAMKQGVFEKIERPWFSHESHPVAIVDGKTIYDSVGEDVSWCIKAYRAGIKIYFDPKVLVTHTKKISISWDIHRTYRQEL